VIHDNDSTVVSAGTLLVSFDTDGKFGGLDRITVANAVTQHSPDSTVKVQLLADEHALSFLCLLESCNEALKTLQYFPAPNAHGTTTVTMKVDDRAHFGSLGRRSDITEFDVVVAPVNDAPDVQVPGRLFLKEAQVLSLGDKVLVSDPDASEDMVGDILFQISCTHGLIRLQCVPFDTAVPSKTVTCRDTVAGLNHALGRLEYIATTVSHGQDTISFIVDDEGNSGLGGPLRVQKEASQCLSQLSLTSPHLLMLLRTALDWSVRHGCTCRPISTLSSKSLSDQIPSCA